ncbi:MAG: hypothetical protein EOL97_14235 [Spirochaetia bacterium]|nr:hypothetical protein [Spirochaetia bacterium]
MNFKKLFIIVIPIILTISLLIIFYILFFKDINIDNPNNNLENSDLNNNEEINEEDLILEDENIENSSEDIETPPEYGLNVEIDGFRYCRYDEECFRKLFLECNIGNHIKFIQEDLPYSFSILNKSDNDCDILIQNLLNSESENINCSFPLDFLNEINFEKILTLDSEVLNNNCK